MTPASRTLSAQIIEGLRGCKTAADVTALAKHHATDMAALRRDPGAAVRLLHIKNFADLQRRLLPR